MATDIGRNPTLANQRYYCPMTSWRLLTVSDPGCRNVVAARRYCRPRISPVVLLSMGIVIHRHFGGDAW